MAGTTSPTDHPPGCWRDRLVNQRQKGSELLDQTLCLRIRSLSERVSHVLGWGFARFGDPDERGIGARETFGRFFPLAAGHPRDLLGEPPHAPGVTPKHRPGQVSPIRHDVLRPTEQATQDAHPVAQNATVRRVVNGRLPHRRIRPEFAPPGDLQCPRQFDDPIIALGARRGTDQVRPTDQRGVIGDGFERDPTERAQDQAIGDTMRGLGVAPARQPLDGDHPQDHLDRRGMPTVRARLGGIGGQGPPSPWGTRHHRRGDDPAR